MSEQVEEVVDGVNVGYDVYEIETEITAKGAELTAFTNGLKKWLAFVATREFQCELAAPAAGRCRRSDIDQRCGAGTIC